MLYLALIPVFLHLIAAHPTLLQRELETVPELNIEKYVGMWYQTFGNRNNWSRYTPFAQCITAEYAVANETSLRLLNANRLLSPAGELFYLRGHVLRTEAPGKLKVQFRDFTRQGDYWIIKLGPQTFGEDGMYEYSVVTGAVLDDDSTLFVLARDPERFTRLYQEEVLQFLAETGFTSYQLEPIENYHGDDCLYVGIDDPNIP